MGSIIPVQKLTVEEIENNIIEEKYFERDEVFLYFLLLIVNMGFKATYGIMRLNQTQKVG